jgi:hypothetical protein
VPKGAKKFLQKVKWRGSFEVRGVRVEDLAERSPDAFRKRFKEGE